MNKRDFLKGGATAIVTSASSSAALAALRPRLDGNSALTNWQAHVGQQFEVDGHPVTLRAATARPTRQTGEQFSLRFVGPLPADLGDGLRALTLGGEPVTTLYLAATPQGLRADFCRLQG